MEYILIAVCIVAVGAWAYKKIGQRRAKAAAEAAVAEAKSLQE